MRKAARSNFGEGLWPTPVFPMLVADWNGRVRVRGMYHGHKCITYKSPFLHKSSSAEEASMKLMKYNCYAPSDVFELFLPKLRIKQRMLRRGDTSGWNACSFVHSNGAINIRFYTQNLISLFNILKSLHSLREEMFTIYFSVYSLSPYSLAVLPIDCLMVIVWPSVILWVGHIKLTFLIGVTENSLNTAVQANSHLWFLP